MLLVVQCSDRAVRWAAGRTDRKREGGRGGRHRSLVSPLQALQRKTGSQTDFSSSPNSVSPQTLLIIPDHNSTCYYQTETPDRKAATSSLPSLCSYNYLALYAACKTYKMFPHFIACVVLCRSEVGSEKEALRQVFNYSEVCPEMTEVSH